MRILFLLPLLIEFICFTHLIILTSTPNAILCTIAIDTSLPYSHSQRKIFQFLKIRLVFHNSFIDAPIQIKKVVSQS
jgi:hypothetical protein